jgi:hypothetical protein
MNGDDSGLHWPARAVLARDQIVGGVDGGDDQESSDGIAELRELPPGYQQQALDELERIKALPTDDPTRYIRPIVDALLGGPSHADPLDG